MSFTSIPMTPTSTNITIDRRALAAATERLSPIEAKVLLILLARCAPESGRFHASIGSLAGATSLPETLLRCALPRLVASGLLIALPAGEPTSFDISRLLGRPEPAPENLPVG